MATRTHEVPAGPDMSFEPKLDGFRALAFSRARRLQSRQGSLALTERFPDVLADLSGLGDVVLDGELVAMRHGRLEFSALRLGPARRAREGITAVLVAFDLLAIDDIDVRGQPLVRRRAQLQALLGHARLAHVQLIEQTTDRSAALEWMSPAWGQAGVEGVLTKPLRSRYLTGTRSGWIKTRQTATIEAVVLGVAGADVLVLGQPSPSGRWRVQGLSHPVAPALGAELATQLRLDESHPETAQLPSSVGGLPGAPPITYLPVRPDVIVEITVDTAIDHGRHRHRITVMRIRDDLTPDDLRFRSSRSDGGLQ